MNAPTLETLQGNVSVHRDSLRLVGIGGSNKVMAGELSRLIRRAYDDVRVPIPRKEGPGALSYPFDDRLALTAVRYHRTSARVLWELYRCSATRLEPLYDQLRGAVASDDRDCFSDGATVSVMAFSVAEFAAGERQLVGTVKNAIVDGAASRGAVVAVDPEHADLQVDVRIVGGEVSVALDLAGMPMHRRGYRHKSGVAPLREDVAALLVMLARHDSRREVLVDPMAGSGTIGIEAAGLGQGRYNWCSGRSPACERWPRFRDVKTSRSQQAVFSDTQPQIIMNEADPEAYAVAERNVETAGVRPCVDLVQGDFRDLGWSRVAKLAEAKGRDPSSGLVLCNPPYGHRLSDPRTTEKLYRELAQWLGQFRGWRAGFLVAHEGFEDALGVRARIKKPVSNGPLNAMFYLYDV
jgi:23S rRNA G2445 N2-methylase RlmL